MNPIQTSMTRDSHTHFIKQLVSNDLNIIGDKICQQWVFTCSGSLPFEERLASCVQLATNKELILSNHLC